MAQNEDEQEAGHPYRQMPKQEARDVDLLRQSSHRMSTSTYFTRTVVSPSIIEPLLKVLDRLEARIAQLEDELRKR